MLKHRVRTFLATGFIMGVEEGRNLFTGDHSDVMKTDTSAIVDSDSRQESLSIRARSLGASPNGTAIRFRDGKKIRIIPDPEKRIPTT